MRSRIVDGDSRLSFWLHVREFAVPPSMIESATARRNAGDWAGACAAARVDVDLSLRTVARAHGAQLAAQVRADLRNLAPDLLRWHMPRVAPDGLLRPGLTVLLARYRSAGRDSGTVQLVARTPPAWADAGQRISLTLWGSATGSCGYPHPRPNRRFRLDLHRHLWDARRAGDLRARSGADGLSTTDGGPDLLGTLPLGCAVDRWAVEAGILLHSEGRTGGSFTVRLGPRHRLVLDLVADGETIAPAAVQGCASRLSVLPDAATWVPPDLALLRAGLIEAGRLHPLVASALAPGNPRADTKRLPHGEGSWRAVECRGEQHRIGLVNGVLVPLDHGADEIRREELLAALTGTPLSCMQAIDEARRQPESLVDVRARLDHGDAAGALDAVAVLLGPDALLPGGALRDELEMAARRRIAHGLFRAGLSARRIPIPLDRRPGDYRAHPRHATR